MSESLNHSFSRFIKKPVHFKIKQVTAWVSRWIIQSFKKYFVQIKTDSFSNETRNWLWENLWINHLSDVSKIIDLFWNKKKIVYDCLRFIEIDGIFSPMCCCTGAVSVTPGFSEQYCVRMETTQFQRRRAGGASASHGLF